MINRKIAMSAFSILSGLALMGGSAFASFSPQVNANGGTFSVTDKAIQIADDSGTSGAPGTFGASIAGFSGSGIVPGTPKTFVFYLHNNGGMDLPLSGQFQNTLGTGTGTGTGHLENDLQVGIQCVNYPTPGTPVVNIADQSYHLYEAETSLGGTITVGQTLKCTLDATLTQGTDKSALTDHGQSLTFDAVFGQTL